VPKRPEQHRSTIAIRQNDIGKRCAERMLHRLPQSSCGFAGTSHATSWRTPQLRYTNRR
jgi:hypothetical protein